MINVILGVNIEATYMRSGFDSEGYLDANWPVGFLTGY